MLCFNSRNTLLRDVRVAEGTMNACPVDPREVFAAAISARANAIVFADGLHVIPATSQLADLELQLLWGTSFFDLNLELTLDDRQTWTPSSVTGHVELGEP